MTQMQKSKWQSDGEDLRFSVPLQKVDQEKRIVSGWATLDNVDTQGDIVTAEASRNAFTRARGNLREMHQPIAVGKIVDFREDEFYNEDDGKFYRGIFVRARVSEGAPETWAKVLDGTLTGFSIGGSINKVSNKMSKDGSKPVRVVEDYDLVELSLVDNPANQLSNIFSIQKTATGSVEIGGMVAETPIENVFMCSLDEEVRTSDSNTADCLECGNEMKNIGWFESGNDRAEKVREIVSEFRTQNTEGGVNMSDEITKSESVSEEETVNATDVEEVHETPTTVLSDGETTSDGEKAENVNEVVDESEEISKKIDELKVVVNDSLVKTREEYQEAVKTLETKIEEATERFMTKASELENKFSKFDEDLTAEKSRLAAMEARLNKVSSSTAMKKSADLEEPAVVKDKKPTWDGAFSIDNLR